MQFGKLNSHLLRKVPEWTAACDIAQLAYAIGLLILRRYFGNLAYGRRAIVKRLEVRTRNERIGSFSSEGRFGSPHDRKRRDWRYPLRSIIIAVLDFGVN